MDVEKNPISFHFQWKGFFFSLGSMKSIFRFLTPLILLLALSCQKEDPPFTASEETLVLSVLAANEEIHSQLMKEEKIPDLTSIKRALQGLSNQTHPSLLALSEAKDNEFKDGQKDLEAFYTALSTFSTKLEPILKKSAAFSEYSAFYCPMVEKTWIAKGLPVRNPFAPDMRDCGDRLP